MKEGSHLESSFGGAPVKPHADAGFLLIRNVSLVELTENGEKDKVL